MVSTTAIPQAMVLTLYSPITKNTKKIRINVTRFACMFTFLEMQEYRLAIGSHY